MKESVGYLLKRTREVREIELEEVSKKTKISVRFLQAIEEGRYHILPGDVFVKGFIRAYAQFLGLNPEEAVEKYVQERLPQTKPIPEKIVKKQRNFNINWIILPFFAFLALFLIFLFYPKKQTKKVDENLSLSVPEKITQEKPQEKVISVQKEKPKIELLFTRHCWLRVEVDGKNVFEGFKEASDKLEYNFKESFVLKVGDAGALQLIKDGIPQPPLGEDGQPVLYKLP